MFDFSGAVGRCRGRVRCGERKNIHILYIRIKENTINNMKLICFSSKTFSRATR
jgi:hypothetical protein